MFSHLQPPPSHAFAVCLRVARPFRHPFTLFFLPPFVFLWRPIILCLHSRPSFSSALLLPPTSAVLSFPPSPPPSPFKDLYILTYRKAIIYIPGHTSIEVLKWEFDKSLRMRMHRHTHTSCMTRILSCYSLLCSHCPASGFACLLFIYVIIV